MKVGIVGYGNLGRAAALAVTQSQNGELVGIFTRRDPQKVVPGVPAPVLPVARIGEYRARVDVLLLCGGSATDLPEWTPRLAEDFHVVDSFDTHGRMAEHFRAVDAAARRSGHVALLAVGWDPGLFSLMRLLSEAVLPDGRSYTFWGPGVSQGHSDAVRRIPGVRDAREYTLPVPESVNAVRAGEDPELTPAQKHTRLCFVVAEEGADRVRISREICQMPYYFADYRTEVRFVTEEELARDHAALPHGGCVLRTGHTGARRQMQHTAEFSLRLDDNPGFTAGVLAAYAGAAVRLARRGESGARSILEIAPADLFPDTVEELRGRYL